jgi:hypothetical protein
MDIGITQASKQPVINPLPLSWLGRPDRPAYLPAWATIGQLTSTQVNNLQCQIGYDLSEWNYAKIGPSNELGRYQISTVTLEKYGILAAGSNLSYGTDCVNYKTCWRQVAVRSTNSYANYLYNITGLSGFLASAIAQDHLNYQIIYDSYTELSRNGAITATDSAEVVAGMIYVGIMLGTDGAYAWRYTNVGQGARYYNGGRYAVTVLSQ